MRIGITTQIEFSVFSCGTTNTCFALAELAKALGHEPTLLNMRGTNDWWQDCTPLAKAFPVAHLESMDLSGCTQQYDIIFEVGMHTLTSVQREALAKRAVWVIRKPFVLNEIESSIYPVNDRPRDLTGICQAWLMTDVTSPDDASAVELIAGVQTSYVPFLWSPMPAEAHARSFGAPQWKVDPSGGFVAHMVDTNMSSASSSTIPLVVMREAARQGLPIHAWRLHNGEMIAKSRFFRDNVLKHCADLDLSGQCVGRQRCVEWTTHPGSIAIAHLRFTRLRPVLLDLAWSGVPVVHNSLSLREIGHGAERFFYSDNSVREGVEALKNLSADAEAGEGWFKSTEAEARREQILRRWSPLSRAVQAVWSIAIQQALDATPSKKRGVSIKKAPVLMKVKEEETNEKVETKEVTKEKEQPVSAPYKKEFNVVFSDMWQAFQPDYNFFTLLLNEAGSRLANPVRVVGHSDGDWGDDRGDPDLVIFGPFGQNWLRFGPSVPRVHYTGENSPAVQHPFVKLNLGHEPYYLKSDYMRVPHWMVSINWFGADVERLMNPRPIPLELATRSSASTLAARKKFCAFVVSNPKNPVRNLAYKWVNSYKAVDSGGALYNTIGDELSAMLGGGGGEWKKVKFYQNYKFVIAYENGCNKGYCTEKYLHAKAAGCIPIYWGDPDVQRDFDLAGAIDARDCKTSDDLIAKIRAVEEDDAEWQKRAAVPALDEYRVKLARRSLSEMARRMFDLMGLKEDALANLPRFLGAEVGSDAAKAGLEYFSPVAATAVAPVVAPLTQGNLEVPLMVTFATFSFLGSLQHWLKAVRAQTAALPTLKALVFIGADVPAESVETLEKAYPFATFEAVPTSWTPPDFADFWEPSHYAWKLWIYHNLSHRNDLSGQMIFYTDAGACLVRWPKAWLTRATQEGICCLEDPREENDRWCGELFCERLGVTDEERAARQIAAGLMIWRAGDAKATTFFDEAFRLGCVRHMIVGPRVGGVGTDGKQYGHRQDQSILSILVRRHAIPLHPLDDVYCEHSMRKTFTSGRSLYFHRGNYTQHIHPITGIHDAFVINLDRRTDRMERFYENHPTLKDCVTRYTAFDGKALSLTPELATLFAPNDFFWKKSVMGCALSHLGLWWKLVNDHPEIENYLIFEDDAKMRPGWQEVVEKSMNHVPEDWDVLYLGGILPPNRTMYEQTLTPVTKYYSRITPNTIFGQPQPTPYFHSCAYAYILSRRGALKIMNNLTKHGGYWTSADHIMCSSVDVMNLYFLTPSVAGCYQDDDPVYANSDFNNFSRVDKFDSDLWNNDERFSADEIQSARAAFQGDFSTAVILKSIYGGVRRAPAIAPDALPALETSSEPLQPLVPFNAPTASIIWENGTSASQRRIITFKEFPINFSKAYERDWLCMLMGGVTQIHVDVVEATAEPPTDTPIVILQRPYVEVISQVLRRWSAAGARFKLLHLSDEATEPEHQDPLFAYLLPGCIGVLRNYLRSDLPAGTESKVLTIPLGWRCSATPNAPDSDDILKHLPSIPFREHHWSFFGTDWKGRAEALKPLTSSKLLGNYKFFGQWNDPANLTREQYLDAVLNSIFVPCPDGVNPETFRFYEALQAGCIPLVVKTPENAEWLRWVTKQVPVMGLASWDDAIRIMISLILKPETMEIYRNQLVKGWQEWTRSLKTKVTHWLRSDEA